MNDFLVFTLREMLLLMNFDQTISLKVLSYKHDKMK